MAAIDDLFGWDWTEASYLGDGVFVMRVDGDIALRTDRETGSNIIVLEPNMLDTLNAWTKKTAGQIGQTRGPLTFQRVYP